MLTADILGITVAIISNSSTPLLHGNVIKWNHFPHHWPFLRGIHRSTVNSPHKGQWRGALMFLWSALNKRLNKQSWGWWFETPPRSLWRHCNFRSEFPFSLTYACSFIIVVLQTMKHAKGDGGLFLTFIRTIYLCNLIQVEIHILTENCHWHRKLHSKLLPFSPPVWQEY